MISKANFLSFSSALAKDFKTIGNFFFNSFEVWMLFSRKILKMNVIDSFLSAKENELSHLAVLKENIFPILESDGEVKKQSLSKFTNQVKGEC